MTFLHKHITSAYILIVVVTAAVYWGILDNYFLNDDFGRLAALWPLQEETLARAFGSMVENSYHWAYYRPLTNMSFYILGKMADLNATWYYASSIALHCITSLVVFALIRLLFVGRASSIWPALTAALFFAIHPRQVESVSYIHDNENIFCGLFFFLGLYFFIKFYNGGRYSHLGAASLSYFLSLLGKEMGVTLPFICLGYALLLGVRTEGQIREKRRMILSSIAAVAFVLVIYFALRFYGLGEFIGGAGETSRLEFSPLRMVRTLLQIILAMILPNDIPGLDLLVSTIRESSVLFLVGLIGAIIACALFVHFSFIGNSHLFGFAAVFIIVSSLPVLNNGISVHQLTGARYLYIPLLGASIVLAELLTKYAVKRAVFAVSFLLLVGYGISAVRNNAMVSTAADMSEGFLLGMGGVVGENEDKQYAIVLPSFYRGMYMLQSSLSPALTLLYGQKGVDFTDRAPLIISIVIDPVDAGDISATREGDWLVITCKDNTGILWKEEFYDNETSRSYDFEFDRSRVINSRGDFISSVMRIRPAPERLIVPSFNINDGYRSRVIKW